MKKTFLAMAVVVMALAQSAQADMIIYQNTFNVGGVIPDGDLGGFADTRMLSMSSAAITDVNVRLTLSGGWNGDLYAYLVHSSGFAVLLNRVGRGTGPGDSAAGYGTAGMDVLLDNIGTAGNIHDVPGPGTSAGWTGTPTYQADGRNISPLATVGSFDSGTPVAPLSSFNGLNGNGAWTLFIADVSGGDQSTLTSWGLEIAAVPEPGSFVEGAVAALLLGGMIGFYRLKGPKAQLQAC